MKKLLSATVALTVSALAISAVSAPALADDKVSLTTGFDYSTGKYGNTQSTDILYVPVTAKYESDNLTLKLTVPYISVTGPGGVIQGFGRVPQPAGGTTGGVSRFGRPSGGTSSATSTNSGLGDVIASAGYTVYTGDALSVDAVGKVKFGTADANKGLGTGRNDYSAELDGYYTLAPKSTLFVTAGYKIVGAPAGVPTTNVPYGMLGFDQKTSEVSNAGVMYSQVNSVSPTIPDQKDVTFYVSKKYSPTLKIQANLLKGFSTSSPDLGVGLMVTDYF